MEAGRRVKEDGQPNDLLRRIAADPAFALDEQELDRLLDPAAFIGRAPEQVDAFLSEEVEPLLAFNPESVVMEEPRV